MGTIRRYITDDISYLIRMFSNIGSVWCSNITSSYESHCFIGQMDRLNNVDYDNDYDDFKPNKLVDRSHPKEGKRNERMRNKLTRKRATQWTVSLLEKDTENIRCQFMK